VFEDVPEKEQCVYCGLYFQARGIGPHRRAHGVINEARGELKDKWM
jgi:hypothetical protein